MSRPAARSGLGLVLAVTGAAKLAGHPRARADLAHVGLPAAARLPLGAVELAVGATALAAPQAVAVRTAAGAATVLMAGALSAHLRVGDGLARMAPALTVMALAGATLARSRDRVGTMDAVVPTSPSA